MNRRALRARRHLLLLAGVQCLLSACASLPAADSAPRRAPLRPQRIVQLHFGADAVYGICTEPACPSPTPKTPAPVAASSAVAPASTPALSRVTARPPVPASTVQPSRLVLNFALGAAHLDARAQRALDHAMEAARHAPRILIQARTDNSGRAPHNQALAVARAQQVHAYLRRRVPTIEQRVEIDARGACCFTADNASAAGRHANRRVELVFFPAQTGITAAPRSARPLPPHSRAPRRRLVSRELACACSPAHRSTSSRRTV